MIVRTLAAVIKPALIGGAITASAAGGFAAWQYAHRDGTTAFERAVATGDRLLISEFGEDADSIVAVDPNNPGSRTEIARIDHAPGWGVFPSLSPGGDAIAYTALPADTAAPSPDSPALAAIVEDNGDVVTLATDVDLLITPVWSPDGSSIVVRKNTPRPGGAGDFELILLGRDGSRSTITSWQSAAVFPIAFSPDGATLYFATLNDRGADLYRVAPDGAGETMIARLSDGIARDWKLSPDGSTMAYSVATQGAQPRIVTMTLDLATGAASEAVADAGSAEFKPAWRPDGDLTVASLNPAGGGEAITVDASGAASSSVPGGAATIDLPVSWSPDGSSLAVLAVDRPNALETGGGRLELVTPDGSRQRVSDQSDVLVVGWIE